MKAFAFHHWSSRHYFMLFNFACASCRTGSEKAKTLDFLCSIHLCIVNKEVTRVRAIHYALHPAVQDIRALLEQY